MKTCSLLLTTAVLFFSGCATLPPPDWVLYGVNSRDLALSQLSPSAGTVSFVGWLDAAAPEKYSLPGAMAVRPSDGAVYVWNNLGSPGSGTNRVLAVVDTCTGAATPVAPSTTPPQGPMQALAFSGDGRLFGFGPHAIGTATYETLFEIDPASAVRTPVTTISVTSPAVTASVVGADFNGSGNLFAVLRTTLSIAPGAATVYRLITVDGSGAVQTIGDLDQNVGTPGSIVFDSGGTLIGAATGGPSGDIFFDIDPTTAAVSNIRAIGGTAPLGLGFAPARTCTDVPPVHWRLVTASEQHACGLAADARAFCWGQNHDGRLGVGDNANRSAPTAVGASTTGIALSFASLTAGGAHTCGITTGGAAYCWGWNWFAQVGTGSSFDQFRSPAAVSTSVSFVTLVAGSTHTCGISDAGQVYCWGSNDQGQLGNGGPANPVLTPAAVSAPGPGVSFSAVTAGAQHTCALTTAGEAYCWGSNDLGQLGTGAAGPQQMSPVPVNAGSVRFSSIDAGMWHTCGVSTAGDAYCWGGNYAGGLGSDSTQVCGTEACTPTPTLVSGGNRFSTVSAGPNHTCGLTTANIALCWGLGTSGQLGTGSLPNSCASGELCSPLPVKVAGERPSRSISTSGGVSCAVAITGVGYCWGSATNGMLGLGPTTQTLQPGRLPNP